MQEVKIKMQPLRKQEELFLFRSCMKDGMTQQQAKDYIGSMKEVIKINHDKHNKEVKKMKAIDFNKEFKRMKVRGNKLKN